jgi:hypothetical protein
LWYSHEYWLNTILICTPALHGGVVADALSRLTTDLQARLTGNFGWRA